MGIDIRLPVGILFLLLGLILVVYGIVGDPSMYQQSLDININLYWGIVLCIFGAFMLLLGRRALRATLREAAPHYGPDSADRK
jgi:hypothetical protein